jgi:hypothetical protein
MSSSDASFLEVAMCWLKLAEKAPDHPDRKKL